jgi:hypothetical protein
MGGKMTARDDLRRQIESTFREVYEDWENGRIPNAKPPDATHAADYALSEIVKASY